MDKIIKRVISKGVKENFYLTILIRSCPNRIMSVSVRENYVTYRYTVPLQNNYLVITPKKYFDNGKTNSFYNTDPNNRWENEW